MKDSESYKGEGLSMKKSALLEGEEFSASADFKRQQKRTIRFGQQGGPRDVSEERALFQKARKERLGGEKKA